MRNALFLFFLCISFLANAQTWKPVNGSKDSRNHYTAFIHASIFIDAQHQLSDATLLIKNDKIIAVGTAVDLPENTIIKDLKGKFIYPSFIDLYSEFGIEKKVDEPRVRRPQLESKKASLFYWNESIQPEKKAVDLFRFNEKDAKRYIKMGFGTVLSHQMDGIIRGTSVLTTLSNKAVYPIILDEAALQYSFFKGKSKQTYPNSLMGIIALIRQTHYDAVWYARNQDNTPYNKSLQELNRVQGLPKIIDAGNTLSMLRADKLGDEFNFQYIIKGNGTEFERIEAIKETKASVIVPVNYPKAYDLSDPYDALRLPLSKMKEWELAKENLRLLSAQEIDFAITSSGIEDPKIFFKNISTSIQSGLSRSVAIQSLTETPARLLYVIDKVGTIEPNKLANFIITSDSLFSSNCRVYSNWIQGSEHVVSSENPIDLEGNYSLNINKRLQFDVKLSQKDLKWVAMVSEKNKDQFQKALFETTSSRVNLNFSLGESSYRLSGSVSDSQSRIWSGKTILNGNWVDWAAIKKNDKSTSKTKSLIDSSLKKVEPVKVFYPNMSYGWDSLPKTDKAIIFRNATVWTNEEKGILKNHDVVIHNGKIQMLGYKINIEVMFPELKEQIIEIDATNKHLTSGIIDEHSHIAIERGVNESGQAITSEVSIGDVINSDDINIYRQLAGGVTTSQLLHGSANPIGGQSAIIKLRWGQTPEKMKVDSADSFIKFALGENVKQSNWGDHNTVRFPQTRMGVEQVYYDAFIRAKEYKADWQLYNAKSKKEKKESIPPRKDLELDALAEILDTNRFITCHSYIQSEINMLMHVADSMGFSINTFTHILEGYKVADKLKEHGAMASTFSDWWAYKFEVNDAIPYNGAILHGQGVVTGFNSDDAEMGRRLNQEAAKAVKYGGLSEEEAWKFVTLNPAKMLHLDDRIGSIKEGKDADIVLWTENPLSVYAKVEQTYIDGIAYFDHNRDLALRKKVILERERLIDLMMAEKKKGKPTQKVELEEKKLYECETIEDVY